MSTGITNAAAPIATTGVPGVAPATSPVQPATAQPAVTASAQSPTAYDPTPVSTGVTGGGLLGDIASSIQAVGGSVSTSLAAFASKAMTDSQNRMQALVNSNGTVDPAALQVFSQEMARHEMTMQMAAKIQEKEERLASVWLR